MKKVLSALFVSLLFIMITSNGHASFLFAEPEPTPEIILSHEEKIVYELLNSLKKSMKNPDSFKVHSGSFLEYGTIGRITSTPSTLYLLYVDISAENSFGGTNRNEWLISYNDYGNGEVTTDFYCVDNPSQSSYGVQNNLNAYIYMMKDSADKVIILNTDNISILMSR